MSAYYIELRYFPCPHGLVCAADTGFPFAPFRFLDDAGREWALY